MTAELPLLSLSLSVDYRNKADVLRNISLDIDRGEIVGLVGESGSGKSTLALTILNLLYLKGGKVRGKAVFEGKDILEMDRRKLRSLRGREVSIVLQSPLSALNPALSIGAQLKEAWRAHGKSSADDCHAAIEEALNNVCLPNDNEFLRRRPSQLSVGQAQRIIIAMAILHKPSLLIADEATSALDTITQAEILSLFRELNRTLGMAMLFISHDLLSVAALCHRIAILHESQIVEFGAPEQIFNSPQHLYTRKLVAALPSKPRDSRDNARNQLTANEALRASVHEPLGVT